MRHNGYVQNKEHKNIKNLSYLQNYLQNGVEY
jgi:hypothetical protein